MFWETTCQTFLGGARIWLQGVLDISALIYLLLASPFWYQIVRRHLFRVRDAARSTVRKAGKQVDWLLECCL